MSRRSLPDPATIEALAARERARAPERAKLAAQPSNRWLERDRYACEVNDEPRARPAKRGPGRPRRDAA